MKLTRERQIYNILARQRIKKKLQIIAQFQGYVLQDLISPETPRELQPLGEIRLHFSNWNTSQTSGGMQTNMHEK